MGADSRCCDCSRWGSCSSDPRTRCSCRDASRPCTDCCPGQRCRNRHPGTTSTTTPARGAIICPPVGTLAAPAAPPATPLPQVPPPNETGIPEALIDSPVAGEAETGGDVNTSSDSGGSDDIASHGTAGSQDESVPAEAEAAPRFEEGEEAEAREDGGEDGTEGIPQGLNGGVAPPEAERPTGSEATATAHPAGGEREGTQIPSRRRTWQARPYPKRTGD